ncbi:MAG: hypothetical protein QOK15_2719 [Nocardioidaceae bacterium]|nr:hypothetical protein [Nocardioidaceae bacterium]
MNDVPAAVPLHPDPRPASYAIQGTLALDLGGGQPGLPETPELQADRASRVRGVCDAEVRSWAARLAQAVVEVVGGQRPVSQLVRWTAADVHRDLERRALLVRRAAGAAPRSVPAQVRSVHVCRPTTEVAEVSVHVRHGHRSRAVAMRLEHRGERWLCTVLEFG